MNTLYSLPAEWHRQSLIQIAWPHEYTDWAYMLDEVERCYVQLASEIAKRQPLMIITPEPQRVEKLLKSNHVDISRIFFFNCCTNDTWSRDNGFITLLDEQGNAQLLDFGFNGWGLKFAANLDNQINAHLYQHQILNGEYRDCRNFILEGGSIESDGKGTLLTTTKCLLSVNRNDTLKQKDIENYLRSTFGLKQVLWLNNGHLDGDDTDSHVDTLARLCPNNTIAYVQCTDKDDMHYEDLRLMESELKAFTTLDGKPFRLLPLPMAKPIFDDAGDRLPATYANFLIMNDAVLYPTYQQPQNDLKAKEILTIAFPEKDIVGVDCRALIQQHGSLHCATMQFPEGVFKL